MIFEEMPEDFDPVCEAAICFVEYSGKVLVLHRQESKPEGGKWGFVGGKKKDGESIHETVIREVWEETGISLRNPTHFKKLFFRYPYRDFVCHIFHEVLEKKEDIVLCDDESKNFMWVTPQEALKMPLLLDGADCIKLFYGIE